MVFITLQVAVKVLQARVYDSELKQKISKVKLHPTLINYDISNDDSWC